MKTAIVAISLTLSFLDADASVTVDYTAQIGQRKVIEYTGEPVPAYRGEVRIGLIDDAFDIASHGNDLYRLQEAWIPLGATPIREVLGEQSRFSDRTIIDQPGFAGRKLYLWIITTTNGSPVSTDFSNVRGHGLFSSTFAHWAVPSDAVLQPGNSALIHSSEIDQSFLGGELTGENLTLTRPASHRLDYRAWELVTFPALVAEEDREPLADPDGDGLANLMAQFLGADPMQGNVAPFEVITESDGFVFEFERSKDVPAGAGRLCISNNLLDWAETDSATEIRVIEDLGDREKVSARVPLERLPESWRGRLFFSLEVDL